MKAVFEELNGDTAVFIADDQPKPYDVDISKLPADISPGDVFEVEIHGDAIKLVKKLPEERKRREQSNKAKREALLKKNKSPLD